MKLSLFSVSYAGYWGQDQLDPAAFIARAAQLGYDAVMLAGKRPHVSPLDADANFVASLQAALARPRRDLRRLGRLHRSCSKFGGRGALPGDADRLRRVVGEAGCPVGGPARADLYRLRIEPYCSPHVVERCRDDTARNVRPSGGHGISLAVQNHHDVAVHTDAMLELLHDVDRGNCKLGCDAWSPALRGEDLYECARKLAPHTAITTNADYVRLPRFRYQPHLVNYQRELPDMVRAVKFGEGFIDYPEFFRGLIDGGFDGLANYEMCSPIRGGGKIENLDAYAAHYVAWMRKHGLAARP